MRTGFFLSLFIHLALLTLLVIPKCGNSSASQDQQGKNQNQSQAEKRTEIIEPEKPNAEEVQVSLVESAVLKKLRRQTKAVKCKESFGGIGVSVHRTHIYESPVYEVDKVYPGYPAAFNDIKVGDIIYDFANIRGEIGTEVTIVVRRDGKDFTKTMIRAKICTKDVEDETQEKEESQTQNPGSSTESSP